VRVERDACVFAERSKGTAAGGEENEGVRFGIVEACAASMITGPGGEENEGFGRNS
jgi:hypothetical protein